MKRSIVLLTLLGLTLATAASAQERLSRREALGIAFALCADLKTFEGTPIPTDVDVKRPVALREGDYGAMVLPESKLNAEAIAKAAGGVVPVGQLWFHRLTPVRDSGPVGSDSLRMVDVNTPEGAATVPQCALAVSRTAAGALELLVYGNRPEPILRVPLKSISAKQDVPIDMSAERGGDEGTITLRILGQFEATLRVTEL